MNNPKLVQQQKDGSLVEYFQTPNVIVGSDNKVVLGVANMTKTNRLIHHLYEVVIPELGEWEELGELYVDKTKKIATYRIVAQPKPTLEDAFISKQAELSSLEAEMRRKLAENSVDALIEGETTAAASVLQKLKEAKQGVLEALQTLFEAKDLDGLLGYDLHSDATKKLIHEIDNLKL